MDKDIYGARFTDAQTEKGMREIYQQYSYIADPHGAVGYLGLEAYQQKVTKTTGVFLETAHPAKFLTVVEDVLQRDIYVPDGLQKVLHKNKEAVSLQNDFNALKHLLLSSSYAEHISKSNF